MSTEPAISPHDKPTNELRQVRVVVHDGPTGQGPISSYHYVIQRKWLVPDMKRAEPIPWNQACSADWILVEKGRDGYFPWYAPAKEEWRDLPIVDQRDV